MFDTININLRSIDTQQLNFVKTVTRDLNVDTTTSRYGTTYTSHIDNLTIRTTTQGLSIGNGSLCKFLHGNNIVNFTRTDTRLAFEKLSDTLHISLNNATVSRMDVAYNFDVTYPPESYFYHLGNLPYYKRLEQMFYKGGRRIVLQFGLRQKTIGVLRQDQGNNQSQRLRSTGISKQKFIAV